MALTGLQIQKLLPKTNCKECGVNTCLAFAMKLAARKAEIGECPYASDEAIEVLSAAYEPPVKGIQLGPERSLRLGEETVLYGDQAYWKQADREAFEEQGVRYRVNRRAAGGNKNLSERWRKINRARSRTRARCEHPFRVIKHLWGFQKVRYRGIAKNLARAQTMFALANLYAVRHRLLPPEGECVL